MPDSPGPNLRLLAPVAVAVFALVFLLILLTSGGLLGGSSDQSAGDSATDGQRERSERQPGQRERSSGPASYMIQTGDTLGSIASDNDVSVERIQELNPQLDPQALTAGQRIKLRE